MIKSKSAAFISVLALVMLPAAELQAASDNTLGMALMSASVQFDGVVVAGSGVTATSSVRTSTGTYVIPFERNLGLCTCTASFGTHSLAVSTVTKQNWINASCPWSNGNQAAVFTAIDAALADADFQLIVFCPQ